MIIQIFTIMKAPTVCGDTGIINIEDILMPQLENRPS